MMRCRDMRRLSSRYLEGDLPAEQASAARGHLRDCAGCQRVVQDEAAIVEAARALDDPPEPRGGWDALWTRIGARVAEQERADAARPRWALWWRAHGMPITVVVSAAAAAAGVLMLSPRLGGSAPGTDPSPAAQARSAPERFLDRAEREIARADRHYIETAEELRALVDAERPRLPPERKAALDAELTDLDEQISAARRRLAVIGLPQPHGRDELYALYRKQLRLLQRAAVGAPIAAIVPSHTGDTR